MQFNNTHSAVTFTYENEHDNKLYFLNISLNRWGNGSISKSAYKKNYNVNQYIHFCSFTPIQHKSDLVRCFTNRGKKNYSEDTIK